MIRAVAFVAASLTLVSSAAAQVSFDAPQAPSLRNEAIVTGDVVRIGDLVDNAGAVARVPIFRSPDLGQSGPVPAALVADTVRPHHILDLDTRGLTEVMVTRASRAITAKDIEASIVRAISQQYVMGDPKNLALTFDGIVRTLQVEPSMSGDLTVARMRFDSCNGRFDATLDIPGNAAALRLPLHFTGTLTETFEAVVPTRALTQGEILKLSDLAIERRPKALLTPTSITTFAQASGLAAKRALRQGEVLRQSDLVKPELVGRNEIVTITYEVPGILLTIRGQALEAGAEGDVINVLNTQSKRNIQAVVTGPGRVSVSAPGPRFASNTPNR
jgi:flagella basal body P-ring formation protein FlgA